MPDPRIQQNPLVSANVQASIPVNLDLEAKYEGKKSPKLSIFHALTFGFILWALFYLMDTIKVLEFLYFLSHTPRSGDLIMFTIKNAPIIGFTPLIFMVMFVAHIVIIIKLRGVSRTTSTPAIAFMIFSTILLVTFNILLVSQMSQIADRANKGKITPIETQVESE